jgi:pimeloyl-ACP methyl ester carboxylesterase
MQISGPCDRWITDRWPPPGDRREKGAMMADTSGPTLSDGTPIVLAERVTIAEDFALAVRRLDEGGTPLLLLHGFPCTSLIWAKVMRPLADAGFDAVAPDLRGYGESDYAPDDFYDLAAFSRDMIALADALGWDRFAVSGHDLGAAVAIQMANTFPERVDRLLLMSHGIPARPEHPEWSSIRQLTPAQAAAIFDYADRQGNDADGLMAELPTPGARRHYAASFYTNRMWCPPGAFASPDLDLLIEPYASARRLRTSFIDYEIIAGKHPLSAPELLDTPVRQPVVVLLGPDDATHAPDAVARCRLAYPDLIGPFIVPDSGHFMQWEQPATVTSALRAFCGR